MDLSELLLELVTIPSETGKEQEISAFVENFLKNIDGFTLTKTGLGLCYQSQKTPGRQTVSFYGHLDTVVCNQDEQPMIKGDFLYGCGASDMKAGLAVMMGLMKEYKADRSRYNLQFVFYDKEEGPFETNGLGPLLKANPSLLQSDFAIVLEPTSNHIQAGCMGGLHAKIKFEGKSAHSARPWEGKNAIFEGLELLGKIQQFGQKEVQIQGLTFYEVMNPTLAKAGKSRNSLPDDFEVNVNYRFAPGKSIQEAKSEMLHYLGSVARVEFVDECPSASVVTDHPILEALKGIDQSPIEPKQAWTDIARLDSAGIPAINFGPGDPAQAHQKNERASLQALSRNFDILRKLIFQN